MRVPVKSLNRELAPGYIRYPSNAFVYGFVRPSIWALHHAGILKRILPRVSALIDGREKNAWHGYHPTQRDIFVCTFPKSGTNWALQIVLQLLFDGELEFDNILDVVPWPDNHFGNKMIDLNDPTVAQSNRHGKRVIMAHGLWEHLPLSQDAKYVFVVRDPKDVFVSLMKFSQTLSLNFLAPSQQAALDAFMVEGQFPFGNWAKHTAQCWKARDQPNVLILSFKEMKRDHANAVRDVAAFIELDADRSLIEKVVRRSSFPFMKSIATAFSPGAIVPWALRPGVMIRSGKQGGSLDVLDETQRTELDRRALAALGQFGVDDFPYGWVADVGS